MYVEHDGMWEVNGEVHKGKEVVSRCGMCWVQHGGGRETFNRKRKGWYGTVDVASTFVLVSVSFPGLSLGWPNERRGSSIMWFSKLGKPKFMFSSAWCVAVYRI